MPIDYSKFDHIGDSDEECSSQRGIKKDLLQHLGNDSGLLRMLRGRRLRPRQSLRLQSLFLTRAERQRYQSRGGASSNLQHLQHNMAKASHASQEWSRAPGGGRPVFNGFGRLLETRHTWRFFNFPS